MFSRDFEARITGQAISYACRVKEQHAQNPAAIFLAEAGLRLASICRRSGIEIIGSSMVEDWFAWCETTLGNLKTMPGVAGLPELNEFQSFLAQTRAGGREAMYQVVLGRNRPGSLLRANFCPWKNTIETATPGSTIGFPREIVSCPTM
jgi:hypothetical protein